MNAARLEIYKQQLYSATPLFGGWLRRRAVEALARDQSPEAARLLAEALMWNSEHVGALVRKALRRLSDQRSIDAVCEVWAATRHAELAGLLAETGWIASAPANVRVLSALKTGRLKVVTQGEPEVIEPLVQAGRDADAEIARLARECLARLEKADTIDEVCARWSTKYEELLTQAIEQGRYVARKPVTARVLTALKVGQLDVLTEGSVEMVRSLAQACVDIDGDVARQARDFIVKLKNADAIDALCQQWAIRRDPLLADVLRRGGYVARQPADVRVLSALKSGRLEILAEDGAEVVEPLLQACEDGDSFIAERARQALRQLKKADAQDALCHKVVEQDHPIAQEAALASGYAPKNSHLRAIYYFLTEQWEKYESLDFDHAMLRAAYESGDENLRLRVVEKARRAGRVEWVGVVSGGRRGLRIGQMSDREWEAVLEVLVTGDKWEEMWRLAQVAPPAWSAQMLNWMKMGGYIPGGKEDQAVYEKLVSLSEGWKEADLRSLIYCGHTHSSEGRKQVDSKSLIYCRAILKEHSDWVTCLAMSADGRMLASGGHDKTLRLWSLPEGKPLEILKGHGEYATLCLAMSAKGRVLASGSNDKKVRLWSLPSGAHLNTLHGHEDWVSGLAMTPDEQLLASASQDNTVRIWRVLDGAPLDMLKMTGDWMRCLAITPDGQTLIGGSNNGVIQLWSLSDGKPLKTLKEYCDWVTCLAISPDGQLLASGSRDNKMRLWRLADGKLLRTLEAHSSPVRCLAISNGGRMLVSGSDDRTVRLWSLPRGEPLMTLQGHADAVRCLAMSADGRVLASGGQDNKIRLWDTRPHPLTQIPIGLTSLEDLDWAQGVLRDEQISDEERRSLEFIVELMQWRRRFDIQLDEEPRRIQVGEFDIEIEG